MASVMSSKLLLQEIEKLSEEEEQDDSESEIALNYIITDYDDRTSALKTVYDLPLEFHEDALRFTRESTYKTRLESAHPSTIHFGKHILSTQDTMSIDKTWGSLAYSVEPNVLQRLLAQKPKHKYVAGTAAKKLQNEIYKQLHMQLDLLPPCKANCKSSDVPKTVFSWGRDHFIDRREENIIWVKMLTSQHSPKSLTDFKLRRDIQECIRYLDFIFFTLLDKEADYDTQMAAMHYIQDTYEFLNNERTLTKECEENSKTFRTEVNRSLALLFSRRNSIQRRKKAALIEIMQNMDVNDPIEIRYQSDWYDCKANQAEMIGKKNSAAIQKEIENYKKQIMKEQYTSQCACNALYTDTQGHKAEFAEFSHRFEVDYEHIFNEISAQSVLLEKLREQRKFMVEQVERFHEEIVLMEERIVRRTEREKRKREEELQAALEKAAKKKAKLEAKRKAKRAK